MKEFIDKLIERLEEQKGSESDYCTALGKTLVRHWNNCVDVCKEIVNELAEEYKLFGNSEQVKVSEMPTGSEDFCEWKYDGKMYDRCPHTETLFARIHNCDENIFKFCPYCGKKIKVAPYTEGE